MCECEEQVNEALAEHNTRLERRIALDPKTGGLESTRPLICVEKIDPKEREKPLLVTATFCPFCGKKYSEEAEEKSA